MLQRGKEGVDILFESDVLHHTIKVVLLAIYATPLKKILMSSPVDIFLQTYMGAVWPKINSNFGSLLPSYTFEPFAEQGLHLINFFLKFFCSVRYSPFIKER